MDNLNCFLCKYNMVKNKCDLFMAFDHCFCSQQCRYDFLLSKEKNKSPIKTTNKIIHQLHRYQLEDWNDDKNVCRVM